MELHAHFETEAADCDGTRLRSWTEAMNEAERQDSFGDIAFHDRVGSYVVNTYSLMCSGTLSVTRHDDGPSMTWHEPTEEGYRHVKVKFCTGECDDDPTYRDLRAESMGY